MAWLGWVPWSHGEAAHSGHMLPVFLHPHHALLFMLLHLGAYSAPGSIHVYNVWFTWSCRWQEAGKTCPYPETRTAPRGHGTSQDAKSNSKKLRSPRETETSEMEARLCLKSHSLKPPNNLQVNKYSARKVGETGII